MSIFDVRKLAGVLATGIVSAAALRCGPPETCLRMSDCSVGFACVAQTCVPEAMSSPDEAGIGEGGARATDAASQPDATEGGTASDAGADSASAADTGAADDGGGTDGSSDF